jgi:hypothetical protein
MSLTQIEVEEKVARTFDQLIAALEQNKIEVLSAIQVG